MPATSKLFHLGLITPLNSRVRTFSTFPSSSGDLQGEICSSQKKVLSLGN